MQVINRTIKSLLIPIILATLVNSCSNNSETKVNNKNENFSKALAIPAVLNDLNDNPDKAEFKLNIQKGKMKFIEGLETSTYGYNGSYLGPVIRVKRGNQVKVNVQNNLQEETTVHWHGLKIPSDADGGPHKTIGSGKEFVPQFTINQPAGTYWFHPHPHEKTAGQVYKGLAGLFIVDDQISEKLDIPKEYGVDDIPIILQDKRFNSDGSLVYKSKNSDNDGMLGDKIIVNGVINPFLEVPKGKVRLRVVNGSNARFYNLALSDNTSFTQIATDGGFLENPVNLKSLMLSPGERAEIIVDFSRYKMDDSVILKSLAFADHGMPSGKNPEEGKIGNGNPFDIMKFVIKKDKTNDYSIPVKLASIEKISESQATNTREFILRDMDNQETTKQGYENHGTSEEQEEHSQHDMHSKHNLGSEHNSHMSHENMGDMKGMFTINGKSFDMKRIDQTIKFGDTEIWSITNKSDMNMAHPFHIHGIQFQIISRNGKQPPENERGWKDTFLIQPDETVKIITTFKDFKGQYMFHCHNLEHEDLGMMGLIEII